MERDAVSADVTVVDNPAEQRFEGYLDGELVVVTEYIPLPGKVIATHTETMPRFEGQGLASRLVAGMIEQLRADGRLLQPQCPYVNAWLKRHPEARDVVDPESPY